MGLFEAGSQVRTAEGLGGAAYIGNWISAVQVAANFLSPFY